jgi:hypothetical protein
LSLDKNETAAVYELKANKAVFGKGFNPIDNPMLVYISLA